MNFDVQEFFVESVFDDSNIQEAVMLTLIQEVFEVDSNILEVVMLTLIFRRFLMLTLTPDVFYAEYLICRSFLCQLSFRRCTEGSRKLLRKTKTSSR